MILVCLQCDAMMHLCRKGRKLCHTGDSPEVHIEGLIEQNSSAFSSDSSHFGFEYLLDHPGM